MDRFDENPASSGEKDAIPGQHGVQSGTPHPLTEPAAHAVNPDATPTSPDLLPQVRPAVAADAQQADEAVLSWLDHDDSVAPANRPTNAPSIDDWDGIDVYESPPPPRRQGRRRVVLPIVLFGLTCVSTFFVGMTCWAPEYYLFVQSDPGMALRRMCISHWDDGLLYMGAVLAILLCHEMGHFVFTVRHHIRASFPYFLPLPITPIGTLGAVIGMDGLRADRKQIFDIGIAGPLAGLLVAVPVLWLGVARLDLTENQFGVYQLDMPLIVRAMAWIAGTPGLQQGAAIWQGQLNPWLMAGWVGLLVTGLNMLPVSQLDGGHVIYALFGRSSRWIARAFMVTVIAYVIVWGKVELTLMIGLILLIGTDHPPTSNDAVELTWFRKALAYGSLAIPLLCIPPRFLITQ
ncbi:MAG: site-2 protease family protein [Pirellulaceae bacterium]